MQYEHCHHCGSPRKYHQCRHWWYAPNRGRRGEGGSWAPCQWDAEDAQDEADRRWRYERDRLVRRRWAAVIFIVLLVAALLIWWR
jgi:hypothetical protein